MANYRNHSSNYSSLNFTEELKEFEYFINKPEIKNLLSITQANNLKNYYQANKRKLLKLEKINKDLIYLSNKPVSVNKISKLIFIYLKKNNL